MLVRENVNLRERTTLRVGGHARYFVEVTDEATLKEALAFARERSATVRVLGGGSNVVVPDEGVDGLVLSMGIRGVTVEERAGKALVTAGAGEPWDAFVAKTVEWRLAGLECLSGIPGQVGATPIQNVGAYGQEVARSIVSVRAFDRIEGTFVTLSNAHCHFGYRDSRFKSSEPGRYVIVAVTFALDPDGAPTIAYPELARALADRARPSLADTRDTVLAIRRAKSMLADPADENGRSCGSFFVNPVVSTETAERVSARLGTLDMPRYPQRDGRVKLSAAWLIERSGFTKGFRSGNVGVSTRHALALVCHEGATSAELLAFAEHVRRTVFERTGIELVPEPVMW
ncbi:MAG: UDP-N-acetylmuramate dehydrogenase [Pseudomonadota bacterium]|nr:MAG: UDP-N-acetylenolpyruvoylglucosamine reductase [Pseudomonadota bacterium]